LFFAFEWVGPPMTAGPSPRPGTTYSGVVVVAGYLTTGEIGGKLRGCSNSFVVPALVTFRTVWIELRE
jgi:hypothetical protein